MASTRPATDRPGETTLDHLLTVLSAPAELLSDPDGQVRAEGAQGFYVGDRRYCSRLEIGVDGVDLQPGAAGLGEAGRAWFEGELPGVQLQRDRRVADRRAVDVITLHNTSSAPLDLRLVLHEFRPGGLRAGGLDLPPRYYGTVDATPLWCCLLHDAWRAGLPDAEVAALLPHLEAALWWIEHTAGGDGFLSYRGSSGGGLANQGWKDSQGAVRWADGAIAARPLALCEVQGYAYAAARSGATLLSAFGRPGADEWREWADRMATRFRAAFWIDDPDGRYPAIALDGHDRPVTGPASNMAHLLTTGILAPDEVKLVADRLAGPDLDSGRGLRTLSSTSRGYDPLSYHRGSVWPHDTAIAVLGLAGAGQHDTARSLGEGLVTTAGEFADRLPELYAEIDGEAISYPTACRPQAWAAAGAIAVVTYLDADLLPTWATPH